LDLLATVAELLGEKLADDAGEDSQSFAAVLLDPSSTHRRLPLISHGAIGRFAITDGHWKLVMPHRKAKTELYDLAADPGESKNVAAEYPETVASLKKKITNIICNGRTTPGTRQPNDTGHWKDLTWIQPDEYETLTARR